MRDAWEVNWDGVNSPADHRVPGHLWWDNPHDDDLNADPLGYGACRYRYNYPSVGELWVNRITTPEGRDCPLIDQGNGHYAGGRTFTGNISRRDEYLTEVENHTGATFEFDVLIPDLHTQVQNDAFNFAFVGRQGSFGLYLSPYCAKLGPITDPNNHLFRHACRDESAIKSVRIDATKNSRYRLILDKLPSRQVRLYIDGVLVLSNQSYPMPFVRTYSPGQGPEAGDVEYEFPYVLLGDNVGNSLKSEVDQNLDVSAAYILSGVRYSRGMFAPEDPIRLPDGVSPGQRKRKPPSLPPNVPVSKMGFEFDALPEVSSPLHRPYRYRPSDFQGSIGQLDEKGNFVSTSMPSKDRGILEMTQGSYLHEKLKGLSGNGAWTLEIRAKLDSQSDERAFAVNMWDRIGSVDLLLSPGKIELAYGHKHVGISKPYLMDTTSDFHTYRLVRKANDNYVYLYIDNDPLPVISDFRMSTSQMNGANAAFETRLWFGWLGQLLPIDWKDQGGKRVPVFRKNFKVWIDFIRWNAS